MKQLFQFPGGTGVITNKHSIFHNIKKLILSFFRNVIKNSWQKESFSCSGSWLKQSKGFSESEGLMIETLCGIQYSTEILVIFTLYRSILRQIFIDSFQRHNMVFPSHHIWIIYASDLKESGFVLFIWFWFCNFWSPFSR